MKPRSHPLSWLPAFLVGASLASAAEIAVGLLIYSGPGFLRSLTTVLGIEALALSVGLWTAPGERPDLSDALRRRWLLCLGAFLVATFFSVAWSLVQGVAGSAWGQALGTAALAGLPVYACGGLLGALSASARRSRETFAVPVGSAAALGASLGFAATGLALTRVLTPSTLLLACIIFLSAAGLVYSHIQDGVVQVQVKARRPSPLGEVRVEERLLPAAGPGARMLFERECLRRWSLADGSPFTPWDVAVFRALHRNPDVPTRVLLIGGGASHLPTMAVREHPSVTVEVTERVAGVVELARELMGSGLSIGADGRVSVTVGNLDDTCEGPPVDLVILDNAALASIGGARGLSARTRASLVERVAPGGLFVIGPLAPAGGAWTLMPGWTLTQHRRELPVPLDELVDGGSKDEVVLVMGRTPSAAAEISDGFVTEQVEALRPYPFAEADVESPTVTPFEPPTAEATPSETDIDASPPPDPRDDPVP